MPAHSTISSVRSGRLIEPWALVIFVVGVAALVLSQAWLRVGTPTSRARSGELAVVASIPPLEWVARAIAPSDASVTVLVPFGAACHAVEPSPSQASAIREAGLLLVAGAGIDEAVVQAAAGADGAPIIVRMDESSDPGDTIRWSESARRDPHRWLDPVQMRRMVEATGRGVAEAMRRSGSPEDAITLVAQRTLEAAAQCDEVDRYCRTRLSGLEGSGLVAAHPGGHWFVERYGLRIVAELGGAHDAESTPGDLAGASEALRSGSARALLVEPGAVPNEVRALAETTGAAIVPLVIVGDGDWPATVRANADALASALAPAPGRTE